MDQKNETNEELSDEELAGVSGGTLQQTEDIIKLLQEAGFEDVDRDTISKTLEQLGLPVTVNCLHVNRGKDDYYFYQNGYKHAITYERFMGLLTEELIKQGLLTRP